MYDVLCLSDCCCDMIFQGLPRLPEPGTEQYCRQFVIKAGGGANTPCGLAALHCSVAYMTALGNDFMGAIVREQLERAGVAMEYVQSDKDARTWVSAVLSTSQDRAFASYAGRRVNCTREDFSAVVRISNWVHTYSSYCFDFPFISDVCQEENVPFSVDAAFAEHQDRHTVRKILSAAELFTPNATEACMLTGCAEPEAALKVLSDICRNVVVTLGGDGCIAWLDGKMWRVYPPAVHMVDANGAGDLFNAGLIAARMEGKCTQDQLRMAAASGALAVTYAGGIGETYNRKAVESIMHDVSVSSVDSI